MKILLLCNKSPYPALEGGPLAMNSIINSVIKAGHHLKILALNTNKYRVEKSDIPESYHMQTGIELIDIDLSIKPAEALFHLISGKSYHVERFISKRFKKRLIEVLKTEKFDIVQMEMLYMTPYLDVIRQYSEAAVILRSHNIEHLIWDRITHETKNPVKRTYLKRLTKQLKNYELSHLNSYDGIAAISKNDANFFRMNGCKIPITDIPFGVEISDYAHTDNSQTEPTLFHLGSMNWLPNLEGIEWFLENAWPPISKYHPTLKLYLAGRGMPERLLNLKTPNVNITGEVNDAKQFISSYKIMVVPLLSGSGIRIKIIEGMAMGKAIISTSIGAEGIHYTNEKDILIADNPDEFVEAVNKFVTNPGLIKTIGKNARQLIREEHSLETVITRLEEFYELVLRK